MTMNTHITIHCSATPPSMDIGVKRILQMHLDRGFDREGYHFIIKRDGERQDGRPLDMQGAHVGGHNPGNIGICLIGGVDENDRPEANFTFQQYQALHHTVMELCRTQDIPLENVLGHKDWPGVKKACPCFEVKEFFSG